MERGFWRFRVTELSLFLIVLVSTLFLLWAWEKTPVITSLLPPKESRLLVKKDIAFDPLPRSSYEHTTSRKEKEIPAATRELEAEDREALEVGKDKIQEIPRNSIGAEGNHNEILGDKNPKQEEHFSDLMTRPKGKVPTSEALMNSANASSTMHKFDDKTSIVLSKNEECNYAKGKWVEDENRLLYSGFDCKQWLAPMWACRLMQRTDFAYEKLRWQPKNCQMDEFQGSKFLRRMQDKTLAFVGDSLGRQQFQSLMCMITGGKESPDVIDVGEEYGLVTPDGGVLPNGWAYRFPSSNTTVLYYWSACLCDIEPINATNPDTDYAMHLDRPPGFLRLFLHKIDVLVLNTGHHWNRGKLKANRWIMYVGGMPNTNRKLAMIGDAKNFAIHSVVKWVNSQLLKHPHLTAFYRSISPRHFVNGDWNTGGSCDNTRPMSVGKEVLQDESSDYSAGSAVKGTGVKLLDITALSQLRDEGHISRYSLTAAPGVQDCLHWCLPGVPDTWNEILFAEIIAMPSTQIE